MKIILQDNHIVYRIVLSTDADFDQYDGYDFGHTVANNFSVSVGDYINNYPEEAVARASTRQDFIDCHGSQDLLIGEMIKTFLSGKDLTAETDEFRAWASAIPNSDIDLTDDDCGLYLASAELYSVVGNVFGMVGISDILERNRERLAPVVVEADEPE